MPAFGGNDGVKATSTFETAFPLQVKASGVIVPFTIIIIQ